jgi:hypothetical protein
MPRTPWLAVAGRKRAAADCLEERAADLRRQAEELEARDRRDAEATAS